MDDKYHENEEKKEIFPSFPLRGHPEEISLSAIFGGRDRVVSPGNFKGAIVNAVFGGVELDLSNTWLEQDTVIDIMALFGGVDIKVPPGVRVELNCTPIFGGASDKSNSGFDPGAPVLYVNATCIFGGVDIK